MKSRNWTAAIAMGALLVTACGSDSDTKGSTTTEGESVAATVTALGAQVDAIEALSASHEAAIAAAADMAAIGAVETKDADDAMAIHHEMGSLLDHMAMCLHDGAAMNTDAMALEIDDLGKEIDAHHMAMMDAADMAAAGTEEGRHHTAMDTLVADMKTQHDSMAAMADGYMCPSGHM